MKVDFQIVKSITIYAVADKKDAKKFIEEMSKCSIFEGAEFEAYKEGDKWFVKVDQPYKRKKVKESKAKPKTKVDKLKKKLGGKK